MERPITVLAITAEKNPSPCIKDQLDALEQMGIRVEQFEIDRSKRFYYLRAAWKVFQMSFQRNRFDVIHGFYGYCGLVARMQFRYPVIVTFQGSDLLGGKNTTLHKRDGMVGSLVARLVDSVIVMSKEMKHFSRRKDTHVIPFGVNTQIFKSLSQAEQRQALNLPLDAKLVLFPWNPNRVEKNYHIAEEAMRILQQEDERIQLLPLYNKPRELVAQYMNACDAMVLVSDHEGSPMAVREAMACNLPIVSVEVGDVPQLIQEVDGCYLCKPEAHDVADKLRRVLHTGQRTNSTQKITNMDVVWAAKQVFEVYESIVNRRKSIQPLKENVRA
jgi:glycosyltransferase involved in cell wall biosynthesis